MNPPARDTGIVAVRREEIATGASEIRAAEATVRGMIGDIFSALGFTAAERAILADTLLEASRAGYASHGVVRIPIFVEDTRVGVITPAVAPVVTHEMAAAVVVDARHCLGPVSTVFAIETPLPRRDKRASVAQPCVTAMILLASDPMSAVLRATG